MKQELMRPELDGQDFVQFNYWDGGRKGLLSGEALHLDVKRMELAYHDNNKRELELTIDISVRRLAPLCLLQLKLNGTCSVTIPEWLFDIFCPGHYMRRIKAVAVSLPCVAAPYAGVHCTVSLLNSRIRTSPDAGASYEATGPDDARFMTCAGSLQSIVTSSGVNDTGMFETNLREERFLPFEGAGAEGTLESHLTGSSRLSLHRLLHHFRCRFSPPIHSPPRVGRQGGEGCARSAVQRSAERNNGVDSILKPPPRFSHRMGLFLRQRRPNSPVYSNREKDFLSLLHASESHHDIRARLLSGKSDYRGWSQRQRSGGCHSFAEHARYDELCLRIGRRNATQRSEQGSFSLGPLHVILTT